MENELYKRRLAAIVAADVVGYSRLMGQDETGTFSRLKALRQNLMEPMIARYNGRVVKLMGDGLLIEFSSIVDAIACSVQLQREITSQNATTPVEQRIEFRIGINLGDVIVEGDDLYGDGVNIAARIEPLAETGGICVSHAARNAVGSKLPVSYEDMGALSLKNIADAVNVYRVVAPSKAIMPEAGTTGVGTVLSSQSGRKSRKKFAVVGAIALIAIVITGSLLWYQRHSVAELTTTELPTIAVIPFINLSADAEQEYFSDGLTEDIITDLSRISSLNVIARHSSFAYKNEPTDIYKIGKALAARYILHGSVRRQQDRVRVNASLVDIFKGTNVWANRYEHTLKDAFELQDEVTRTIVAALAVNLTSEEQRYLARTREINQDAYDLLLRGLVPLRQFSIEGNLLARQYFEQAVALDPNYARAYANLALTYARESVFVFGEYSEASNRKGMMFADRAEAIDDKLTQTHFARAVLFQAQRDYTAAEASSRRTIELDPNYADGHILLANTLTYNGKFEEVQTQIARAKSLNPHYPFSYMGVEGQYFYVTKRYEEAAQTFEQALKRNPQYALGRLYLIASYGQLGMLDDAAWELDEFLVLRPDYSLSVARDESVFRRPEHTQAFVEGLRKAGLQ